MTWERDRPRAFVAALTTAADAQVGVQLYALAPGDPMSMYHWEANQEGFLVLSGEASLIVEDEEHPLRQWDYFHCPPGVGHTIVGAGSGTCTILALGARISDEGGYPYSAVAMTHGASAEEETAEPKVAYARFPAVEPAEFREEWLP
jgi:uncharacterized cupin superfamily protein